MAKDKRTYTKKIEHSADISYENEFRFDNVHAPKHYLHGKKETIDAVSYTHLTLPTIYSV